MCLCAKSLSCTRKKKRNEQKNEKRTKETWIILCQIYRKAIMEKGNVTLSVCMRVYISHVRTNERILKYTCLPPILLRLTHVCVCVCVCVCTATRFFFSFIRPFCFPDSIRTAAVPLSI